MNISMRTLIKPQVTESAAVGKIGMAFIRNKNIQSRRFPDLPRRWPTRSISLWLTPKKRRPSFRRKSSNLSAPQYNINAAIIRPNADKTISNSRYMSPAWRAWAATPAGIRTINDGIGETSSSKNVPTNTNSSSETCCDKRSKKIVSVSILVPYAFHPKYNLQTA